MIDIQIDSKRLYGFFGSMTPKEQVKVLRKVMTRNRNLLRQRAGDILMSRLRSVEHPREMRKMIWGETYSKTPGFRVSVAGDKHLYPSRMNRKRGKPGEKRELPLARWLEEGTLGRETRAWRHPRYTGRLPAIGFMEQAHSEIDGTIQGDLEASFIQEVQKLAKKHGAEV